MRIAIGSEGEILERVRAVIPAHMPVGVSLDLHGHVTARMLQPNVFLVGHREYPHIDMLETGERVARLLLDVLAGRRRPVMALAMRRLTLTRVTRPLFPLDDLRNDRAGTGPTSS